MFLRLTENVPDIYVKESRDFQLLCRLYDMTHQDIRYHIDTMTDALTAEKANNRILPLLADRVGFRTNKHIDDNVLRYIISAFPYIIKNKGTKKGIEQAAATILKAENSIDPPTITIDNTNYIITITTPIKIFNKVALEELLKYIIPTGYIFEISEGKRADSSKPQQFYHNDSAAYLRASNDNRDKPNALAVIRGSAEGTNDPESDTTKLKLNLKDYTYTGNTADFIASNVGAVGLTVVGIEKENNNG